MLLNHIAASLLFSGPLFWMGLWMVVDPAGIAELAGFLVRVAGRLVRTFRGPALEPDAEAAISSRLLRRRLRLAGLALVVVAVVV